MYNPFRERLPGKKDATKPEQAPMTGPERTALLADCRKQLEQILKMREMGDGHPADEGQIRRLEAKIRELGG
jgi:hypothetical protein